MISIIKVAVLAYVGYTVLLFLMQRRMLFPGGARDAGRDASSPVPLGVDPSLPTYVRHGARKELE